MTTPIVNPVLTIHKLNTLDTSNLTDAIFTFFENLQSSFTMPAIGDQVTLKVEDSGRYAIGASVWINGIGFLDIVGISDSTTLYLQNNGAEGNEIQGTSVPIGSVFSFSPPRPVQVVASFYLTDTLAQAFTVPSGTANGSLYVNNGNWYKVGMIVYVQGAGYFRITTYDSGTNLLTVKNIGQNNAAGGVIVAAGTAVNPVMEPFTMPDNTPSEQWGVLASQTLSANNFASPGVVTFPVAFAVAPTNIQITMHSATDAGAVGSTQFYASGITTTGFNIVWDSDLTAVVNFHWVAKR